MKFFIILSLTIAFIQFTNCVENNNDYNDDAGLFGDDDEEDTAEDDGPKPIYDIQNAQNLFKKYVKDYGKTYKDDDDYQQHYQNFLKSLKEINQINSDKENSGTVDINLFSDFSDSEFKSFGGSRFS